MLLPLALMWAGQAELMAALQRACSHEHLREAVAGLCATLLESSRVRAAVIRKGIKVRDCLLAVPLFLSQTQCVSILPFFCIAPSALCFLPFFISPVDAHCCCRDLTSLGGGQPVATRLHTCVAPLYPSPSLALVCRSSSPQPSPRRDGLLFSICLFSIFSSHYLTDTHILPLSTLQGFLSSS